MPVPCPLAQMIDIVPRAAGRVAARVGLVVERLSIPLLLPPCPRDDAYLILWTWVLAFIETIDSAVHGSEGEKEAKRFRAARTVKGGWGVGGGVQFQSSSDSW